MYFQVIISIAQIADSTVLVLAGEGAGRLQQMGTGVVVRGNGVVLTAAHIVKDAREVQVRLRNGEVLDSVQLIGVDECRDIASLQITASAKALPLASTAPTIGDPVYAVGNVQGSGWVAISGVFSAVRLADQIPNLGAGFRIIQFTAEGGPGASGSPLVNAKGELLGVIVRGGSSGQLFAIPADSVINLADLPTRRPLGSGANLQLPSSGQLQPSAGSTAAANVKAGEVIRNSKTAFVISKSVFFTPDGLVRELQKQPDFQKLGITMVSDARIADLYFQIDRPLFTYRFTFEIVDRRTSAILGSGRVTAFDGSIAAGPIAKGIANQLKVLRNDGASAVKSPDRSK